MKRSFKRTSNRVLSLILSICLIFSVMTISLTAFAEENPTAYKVTTAAPAIPMR
jgi:hypothetical protein